MQYPDYDATADIEVINNNIKKLVQNAEEQDAQIKSKEPIINKKTGFNLDKTDLTENDSNKLFSAKGALNLFNTLTTNFTDAINIAKEALRIDIGKKYNKVGTLINNGDDLNNYITAGHFRVDGDALAKTIGNRPFLEDACAFTLVVDHIGTTGYNYVIQIARNYASGEIKVRVLVGYPTPSWSNWSSQWDSSNTPKTNLTENDSNKIFTPKGALDLKNWLVENYTTLMNNIRDTLTNTINTKTPHGGYENTTQDLKNEVDTKYNNIGISIPYNADLNNYKTAGHFKTEGDSLAQTIVNRPFVGTAASFTLVVDHIDSSGIDHIIQIARHYRTGEIRIRIFNSAWGEWLTQWDSSNAPKSSRLDFDSEIAIATSKAIKLLNDGKISRDGDYQLTGDYKTTGSYSATKFIANNNYGYMCKDTNGVDKYVALIGTDGRLHIGWNNEIPITLDASDIKIQNHTPFHDGNLNINYQQGLLRPLQLYTANDLDNIGQGFWGTYGDSVAASLGNAPFKERGQAASFGMIGLGYSSNSVGATSALDDHLIGQIAISVYDGEMKCRNKGRYASWRTIFDSTNCRASFAASSQHGSFTMPNDVTIQYGYGDTGASGSTYVVQLHKAFKEGFSVVCTGSGGGHYGVFNARPNGLGSFIIDAGNMVLGNFNGSKFRWIAIGK